MQWGALGIMEYLQGAEARDRKEVDFGIQYREKEMGKQEKQRTNR
jgi:hypothetical protein